MRISRRIHRRVADTRPFEAISTRSVAMPRPRPLMKVDVTASKGQRPSNWTRPGFSYQRPVFRRSRRRCRRVHSPTSSGASALPQRWPPRSRRSIAGFPDRLDDGPRCDGCAGQLVEFATVSLDPPATWCRVTERAAVELPHPVGLARLDPIAEPRRLPMRQHVNAGYPAIDIDADQQPDGARVTVPGAHDEQGGDRRLT